MSRPRRPLHAMPKKSSWTPKNFVPTNEKVSRADCQEFFVCIFIKIHCVQIFKERLSLIKKWVRNFHHSKKGQ